MSIRNPLTPPDEQELSKFAQGVNKGRIPFYKEVAGTIKSTRKTIGGLIGDTVGLVTVPVETGLNIASWVAGGLSGTGYKSSHGIGSARRSIKRTLQGESGNSMSA